MHIRFVTMQKLRVLAGLPPQKATLFPLKRRSRAPPPKKISLDAVEKDSSPWRVVSNLRQSTIPTELSKNYRDNHNLQWTRTNSVANLVPIMRSTRTDWAFQIHTEWTKCALTVLETWDVKKNPIKFTRQFPSHISVTAVHSPLLDRKASVTVRGKFKAQSVPTILSLINNMHTANKYIPTASRNTGRPKKRWKDTNNHANETRMEWFLHCS